MEIDIKKLEKIGTTLGTMISFNNLQRFVDCKLSSNQYEDGLIYSPKQNKWFEGNTFNVTEKQEMIQAILNYTPSNNEVKKIPRKKMTQEELAHCREFDAKIDGDSHWMGY